jgi:5-formyltetrahydrofolate cyclo-ligase
MSGPLSEVHASKQRIRERIWQQIDADPAARTPRPAAGRIPGFAGAEAAAERLAALPGWQAARVLKLNPDTPQRARCRLARSRTPR